MATLRRYFARYHHTKSAVPTTFVVFSKNLKTAHAEASAMIHSKGGIHPFGNGKFELSANDFSTKVYTVKLLP